MAKQIEVILKDFIRHVSDLKAEDDPAGTGFHREFRVCIESACCFFFYGPLSRKLVSCVTAVAKNKLYRFKRKSVQTVEKHLDSSFVCRYPES